jgi:C4-dicarboxylate-specific signal transduction histidine kinase
MNADATFTKEQSIEKLERELSYYRRQLNDQGASLLRMQEEQARTFREARRSRTVVKLLREAYRLGDVSTGAGDLSGPMLEIVVENALCDRAALLREEARGSGRFLVVDAIGLPPGATNTVVCIQYPPEFLFTSARAPDLTEAEPMIGLMQLPYVLWAHDRASGHAFLIANRSDTNVQRPFEEGDRQFIESALSVYMDVLYRKQAESRLRQAKQTAEASDVARMRFLHMLAEEMRPPLRTLADLAQRLGDAPMAGGGVRAGTQIGEIATYLNTLLEDATHLAAAEDRAPLLDVEWLSVEDVTRAAMRAVYGRAVRDGVELTARMPRRRIKVCVDRVWMQHILQHLISSAVRLTEEGCSVRIEAGRRSDGSLEVVVSSGPARVLSREERPLLDPIVGDGWAAGGDLAVTRRLIEAHAGMLTIERSADGGVRARLFLPGEITRDDELVDA